MLRNSGKHIRKYLPLYRSASHLGFINPLHVEVASIGTVPRTFALFFLFYSKCACLGEVERIVGIVNLAVSIVSIHIVNLREFVLQRFEIATVFFLRDVAFQSPKQVVHHTQFWKFSTRRDSAHESRLIVPFALHGKRLFQGLLKSVKRVALPFAEVKRVIAFRQKVEAGEQFIQDIEVKFGSIPVVLAVKNLRDFAPDDYVHLDVIQPAQQLNEFQAHFEMVFRSVQKPIWLSNAENGVEQIIGQDFPLKIQHLFPERPTVAGYYHAQHEDRLEVRLVPKRQLAFCVKGGAAGLVNEERDLRHTKYYSFQKWCDYR